MLIKEKAFHFITTVPLCAGVCDPVQNSACKSGIQLGRHSTVVDSSRRENVSFPDQPVVERQAAPSYFRPNPSS